MRIIVLASIMSFLPACNNNEEQLRSRTNLIAGNNRVTDPKKNSKPTVNKSENAESKKIDEPTQEENEDDSSNSTSNKQPASPQQPQQSNDNSSLIQELQEKIKTLESSNSELVSLRNEIAELKSATPTEQQVDTTQADRLAELENALADLTSAYAEKDSDYAKLQQQLEDLKNQTPSSSGQNNSDGPQPTVAPQPNPGPNNAPANDPKTPKNNKDKNKDKNKNDNKKDETPAKLNCPAPMPILESPINRSKGDCDSKCVDNLVAAARYVNVLKNVTPRITDVPSNKEWKKWKPKAVAQEVFRKINEAGTNASKVGYKETCNPLGGKRFN